MGEIIRNLTDRPLCPNSTNMPIHPAHTIRNRMLDAFYNAAEKNDDNEMPEPVDKAYYAAAYGPSTDDRMWLFREAVSFMQGREYITVESWWFRCFICGLNLPAQRREAIK